MEFDLSDFHASTFLKVLKENKNNNKIKCIIMLNENNTSCSKLTSLWAETFERPQWLNASVLRADSTIPNIKLG